MLVAEDLGYSGAALEMRVPNYHAPGESQLSPVVNESRVVALINGRNFL